MQASSIVKKLNKAVKNDTQQHKSLSCFKMLKTDLPLLAVTISDNFVKSTANEITAFACSNSVETVLKFVENNKQLLVTGAADIAQIRHQVEKVGRELASNLSDADFQLDLQDLISQHIEDTLVELKNELLLFLLPLILTKYEQDQARKKIF